MIKVLQVKRVVVLAVFMAICLSGSKVRAFQFSRFSHGTVVMAGTTIKIRLDPGNISPLFGVLLTTTRGVIKAKLDSILPYEWSVKIPETYYGPLTFKAIGRRYIPVPNPPQTSLTIFVVFSVIRLGDPSEIEISPVIKISSFKPVALRGRGWPGRDLADLDPD